MSKHVAALVYRKRIGAMVKQAVMAYCAERANDDGSGIWASNSGRTGLSPSLPGVNSTARMSDVVVSIARCTLRHCRRP